MIGRGAFQSALFPGIRLHWGRGYNPQAMMYDKVLTRTKDSTQAYEDDQQSLGFGLVPEKGEGAPLQYATNSEGLLKRYVWTSFALGFTVSRELVDDQKYRVVQDMSNDLGVSARHTVETEAAELVNDAFDGNTYTGVDGLALAHIAHTSSSGGATQNNRPIDDTGAAADVDLSTTALNVMETDVGDWTDDQGIPIAAKVNTLVVSTQQRALGTQLLFSPDMPDTAQRSINPYHSSHNPNKMKLVVWRGYLSDATQWTGITDVRNGLKFTWRNAWELAEAPDFDTKGRKYSIWGRFGLGFTDWRGAYSCPGAV